ncbi:RNA recognition motif (RRM)-containing protein [Forsythia ovata]|uniref:RNA recognition motif (RRM)-containing protein n=1 Tax=Forsythia ovata TaxID=205694 RepID=A0ABD1S7D9_9LAMI
MSGREGRGRSRRDYPAKSEEKAQHGRGNNPPSRHLWVGNLSHNLTENSLAHHFLKFGDLESLAFQPGRSYAFINYRNDEDAFLAVRELQGFILAGNPLRIEFAKAEKSTLPSREADYSQRRDESRLTARGSPFTHRESRAYHSPEPPYLDKPKTNNKDADPSEVLWIGFPAQLKVDEFILRKAFSPFGEIEKITAFPGRTYAFVRFRNISAACRAKNTLQGKLFGNPRVHICFAKSESGTSNREKNSIDAPPSPHFGSYGRQGSPEYFRSDRNYGDVTGESSIRSHFIPNLEPGESGFGRKANIWASGNVANEQRRYPEQESEPGLRRNVYEHRNSPSRDRGTHFREYSPQKFSRQGPFYDDPWDLPEDASFLQGGKKLKTIAFPPENELPEYPFSDSEKVKRGVPKTYPDFPQSEVHDKNFDSRPISYRPIPDRAMNSTQQYGERSDNWNASYDNFQVSSVPLPPPDRKRLTPELHELSRNEEWKWEGTIAKGGTPVCRARCFRVGKPLDMPLPEYLDCTARTNLDMLAKHYYQAASAWVVFFVPATDPDIAFYNEFMNYLGEKQRAAVAKLDERTTLFLVPPSEFSEKVLKVPGKLSISGVILRLEPQGSSYGSSPQNQNKETTITSFQGNAPYQKPISPSGPYLSMHPFTKFEKPVISATPIPGTVSSGALPAPLLGSGHSMNNMPEHFNTQQHDHLLHQQKLASGTNWSPHDLQNLNSNTMNISSQASNSSVGPMGYSALPRSMQETPQNNYTSEISGISSSGNGKFSLQEKPPLTPPLPAGGLRPEQLAQLASTLFGQQGQLSGVSTDEGYRQPGNTNQSGYSSIPSQNYGLPNNQVSSEFSSAPFGQVQQLQQQQQTPNLVATPQMNLQLQNAGQEDADADPQKRLQATLQLAAALLQQIQQGKGT